MLVDAPVTRYNAGTMTTDAPRARSRLDRSLYHRVSVGLDRLRPMAQRDGGDFELVDVDENGVVHVRLLGTCVGCPSSSVTLTLGIERYLKDQIPEVTAVVCA